MDKILYGSGKDKIEFSNIRMIMVSIHNKNIEFEGVLRNIERRFKDTSSDYVREQMEKYMTEQPCPSCKGYRLKPETLAVKIAW